MDSSVIYFVTWLIIVIALFIINKTLGADSIKDVVTKTTLIIQYAEAFVSWAKQFKSELSGPEKMDAVIKKLSDIADKNDINMTKEEIRAIAQKAYDDMKNKEDISKIIISSSIDDTNTVNN